MIFDYYGNVRLCCYDWRGLGYIGNIYCNSLNELVHWWGLNRDAISGERMDMGDCEAAYKSGSRSYSVIFECAPQVCRTCTAPGRSTYITNFVEAPAEAARKYREETLSHGK